MVEASPKSYFRGPLGVVHDRGKIWTRALIPDGNVAFYHHDVVGAWLVEALGKYFELERKEAEDLLWAVRHHMQGHDFPRMSTQKQDAFMSHRGIEHLIALQEADALCSIRQDRSHGEINRVHFEPARACHEAGKKKRLADAAFKEPISAGDLATLGTPTGPQLEQALRALRASFDRGEIRNRNKLLAAAASLIRLPSDKKTPTS